MWLNFHTSNFFGGGWKPIDGNSAIIENFGLDLSYGNEPSQINSAEGWGDGNASLWVDKAHRGKLDSVGI